MMGAIRREVYEQHLAQYPNEEELLKPFLDGFYVTWARRRRAYNTELSVYFLNPEDFIQETYGFSQEILLVYSPFAKMESRTIQAAESFLTDEPGKGRVEKLNYFLISEAADVEEWISSYGAVNQEARIIVSFFAKELRGSKGDSWFVRNKLNDQMYSRDLFDYRLPLEKDTYFFGRKDVLARYYDSVKRSENRGLFGLRKTGKTSLLYKLERVIEGETTASYFYYDCQSPSIRKLRWFELLAKIIKDISAKYKVKAKGRLDEVNIADTFANLVSKLPSDTRVVLVFDEIEYISYLATLDLHWKHDFIDFWHAFRNCQSRYRRISTIVAGVNPNVAEEAIVNQVANPLFGIVSYEFLKGFELEEMKGMVRTLGKRMGMSFSAEALKYIHNRYGGHPLLIRIVCGHINSHLSAQNVDKPVEIAKETLVDTEEERDSDLIFYCRHVVSELHRFYPDEYTMLEYLASGQVADFIELSDSEFMSHLDAYGLLSNDKNGLPEISVPVIKRYVGLELAKREGRKTIYRVVPFKERADWLVRRTKNIVHDLRFLEKLIKNNSLPPLFGINSFAEADIFRESRVCQNEDDFNSFSSCCNRCFVESIENYGTDIKKKKYFWEEIKRTYPGLFDALYRIKLYRHDRMHLELYPGINSSLLEYLKRDLEGKPPRQVEDVYFVLQQCILDGLLAGIQVEINKLN